MTALLVYSNATPPVAIHDDAFFVPARYTLDRESIARIFTEDMWASTGSPSGVYRPLVMLSIAANGAMFGRDPVGYHATNVALHAAASLAVFFLLLALLGAGQAWIAALAGMIFAVHPVHTEVVGSVFNRSEILATTLVTIALTVLARWHDKRAVLAWSLVAVLYFLALLCRESAASLPALAMLMLWFLHADEPLSARVRRVLPAAFLAIPLAEYFVLRGFALASNVQAAAPALGVDAGQDLSSRFLYSLAALREYARMMAWPYPLRVSYENFTADRIAPAVLVHSLLIGTAIALRRRAALVSFAIAFFYVSLIPSTRLFTSSGATLAIGGFVLLKPQTGLVLVAERVAYLPSVAMTIACAVGLGALARTIGARRAAAIALAAIAAASLVTFDRNRDWASAPELFAAEVESFPDNADGWRLYVSALSNSGRFDEAAVACDAQLEKSAVSAQLFNNCGVVYDRLQRDEAAIRAYTRAIEQGLVTVGHANRGRVYARMGSMAQAEAEFVAAAESENDPARRHYRNGLTLARFHPDRKADARREFEAALALRPDYGAAKEALSRLGR